MRLHSQEVKDRWGPFPVLHVPHGHAWRGHCWPENGSLTLTSLALTERMLFSKSAHKASFPLFKTSLEVTNLILAYQDSLSWMF